MTITIPSGRTLPLKAKTGGGFSSQGFDGSVPVSGFSPNADFSLADNGDGTLTVTDSQSRFGAKPNAALPVWFIDFGSGSTQAHPTLSRQQKNLPWTSVCQLTTSTVKAGSTHSMIVDTDADGGPVFEADGALQGDEAIQLPTNSGRKYFRHIDYYNDFLGADLDSATSGSLNLKTQRWQINNLNQTTEPYTVTVMQATGGEFYRFAFSGDGGDIYDSSMYGFAELSTKRWRAEEEYHEVSSGAGLTDANMYGVLDGQLRFSRLNMDSHKGFDPATNQWEHYKLANFNVWAATGVCPWLYNVIYIDDSWCRVYITDKATWNDAEVKAIEIQVPTAWTSGSLTFQKREGQFASLVGKYLWVVDNDDNKILVGSWV